MSKYKEVRKAIRQCTGTGSCRDCRYTGREECIENMMRDALAVMKKLKKKGQKK